MISASAVDISPLLIGFLSEVMFSDVFRFANCSNIGGLQFEELALAAKWQLFWGIVTDLIQAIPPFSTTPDTLEIAINDVSSWIGSISRYRETPSFKIGQSLAYKR